MCKKTYRIKIVVFQCLIKKVIKKSFFLKKGVDNGIRIVYKQFHRRDEATTKSDGVIEKIVNKKRIYRQYVLEDI